MSVDLAPWPPPQWSPVPYEGCIGVESRVLAREPEAFVAMLRFGERATIHEHPGPNETIVICLEGEGFTSVADAASPLRAGERARWPQGVPHRLWTETSGMVTLMVELPR